MSCFSCTSTNIGICETSSNSCYNNERTPANNNESLSANNNESTSANNNESLIL